MSVRLTFPCAYGTLKIQFEKAFMTDGGLWEKPQWNETPVLPAVWAVYGNVHILPFCFAGAGGIDSFRKINY